MKTGPCFSTINILKEKIRRDSMFQVIHLPQEITTLLCLSEQERLVIEIALNYILHQLRYDKDKDVYYCLLSSDQREDRKVIYPEELRILENLSARIIGGINNE